MFRRFYNAARITAEIEPDGPLLIAKGGHVSDPTAPDMACVRSQRAGVSTVYLPGASLKGVLRAHVERLLLTHLGPQAAESPFGSDLPRREAAAQTRKAGNTADAYRLSCEADRLFGSTQVAGRLRVDDAYPDATSGGPAVATEVRFGVAIDRAKQSVAAGPFESEAILSGRFGFRAGLENFDLWMLGLVLQALDDVHAGFVQVGHSKSRGFGTVRLENPTLRVRQLAGGAGLAGAGALEHDAAVRDAYGLDAADVIARPGGTAGVPVGLFEEHEWRGKDALRQVREAILGQRFEAFRAQAARAAVGTPTPGPGPGAGARHG